MDNLLLVDILEPLVYLINDFPCGFVERQGLVGFDDLGEIPSIAQLCYYVGVVLRAQDLVAL